MGRGDRWKFDVLRGARRILRRTLDLSRRIRREDRASAAVEFAVLSVPFLAVLLSVLETGVVLLFNTSLDHTAQQIARLIKTGQVQAYDVQNAADFRARVLCPAGGGGVLPGYFVCSRLILDVRIASTASGADLSKDFYNNAGARQFCLGAAGSLVVLRIGYAFPAILPILTLLPDGSVAQSRAGLVDDVPEAPGWNHLLFSAAIFQNETVAPATSAGCAS